MNNEPVAWMHPDGKFNKKETWFFNIPLYTHPVKEQDGCGNCHACLVGVAEHGLPITFQRMILCPDCGNKRCPKASNHRHQCTESNEPNQHGSIYTHPVKELTDEEIWELAKEIGWKEVMIPLIIPLGRAILKKADNK